MQGVGRGIPMFRAYEDDFLKLDDQIISSSFILHNTELIAPWGPEKLADICVKDFAALFASSPEVLLIGTGRTTSFPSPDVMQALDDANLGYEFMDSRAAARTYNILVEEGRTVSVAMLLPGAR